MAKANGKPKPQDQTNGATAVAEPPTDNTTGEDGPVRTFSYLVYHDTYVQAQVWKKVVEKQDGGSFVTYEVNVRKRYKDSKDREWKTLYSFRGSELYAVKHALAQAEAWILETRVQNSPNGQ
jgi:hypothetical protein